MIKIGHAGSDEKGNYVNGAAGDQNGREVCIREWYNRPWNVVLRPKSVFVAAKSVRACVDICRNSNVGYDQNQRTTLHTQAQAAGWDMKKIMIPCECDCSSLMAVCAIAAGVRVSKDIYTGNMVAAFRNTGEYEVLKEKKYLSSDQYLMPGDILVYEGHHTAMALQYGALARYRIGWNYDMNGWWYCKEDGEFICSDWRIINHHKYLFGKSGYMITGWVQKNGKWYYLEESGDYEGALWHEGDDEGALERWYIE